MDVTFSVNGDRIRLDVSPAAPSPTRSARTAAYRHPPRL